MFLVLEEETSLMQLGTIQRIVPSTLVGKGSSSLVVIVDFLMPISESIIPFDWQ